MRKYHIFLTMSILILVNLNTVYAQEEYSNNLWIDFGLLRDNLAGHSPRVACNPSNPDSCIVVYYFSGDAFSGSSLSLRYTYDGFDTIGSAQNVPVTVNYATSGIDSLAANYALPYDVVYYDGKFWVIFDSGSGGSSYAYTWTLADGFTQSWNFSSSTSILEIQDVGEDKLVFGMAISGGNQLTPTWYYLDNKTIESSLTPIVTPFQTYSPLDISGFVARHGSTTIYNVTASAKTNVGAWNNGTLTSLGAFAETNDGIWYWDGSRLFYRTNDSVRYSTTTDLSSFGSGEVYYTFNASVQESINYTDYDSSGGIMSYAFKKYSNETGTFYSYRQGLFAAQTPLRHLRIAYPTAINIDDFSVENVNVTAILDCDDYSLTYTDSGNFIDFYTSCENNTLVLITSGYYPQTESLDVVLDESCEPTTITINQQYRKPYDFTVRVADALTGERVENASVTVDSISNATDVNGETVIQDFFPVTSSSFASTKIGCDYDLTFSGTPKAVSVLATKSGYSTYSATEYFARTPLGDPLTDFDRDYSFRMTPPSTQLNVRAFTKDAVELDVETVDINVYGANTTYLFSDGTYYSQSYSDSVPSLFVLVDNRSSYSVNVTLEYCNEYHQQNITVVEGSYQEAIFNLDLKSDSLCCETNLDCPSSFCEGKYWKRADGCTAGSCQYTAIVCDSATLCDDSRGCFDYKGSQSCETDDDCLNYSQCITSYKSRVGLCGSDNLCIFKDMLCDSCNSTTGLCAESQLCIELGAIRHRFLIQTTTQPFIDGIYTTYQDVDYYCGLDNRAERKCISGAVIPKSVDLVGITTLPDAWSYTTNTTSYIFHDISIYCNSLCNITYDYCEYGCNAETGYCHLSPTSTEGQISIYTDMIVDWWYLFFPTSASQTIAYIFISLMIAGSLTYYIGKNGSSNNGLIFIGSTIAMSLAGIPLGTIPFFVGVLYAVLAGFLVMKMWRGA